MLIYKYRAEACYVLKDFEGAIQDYTEDKLGAIEDFTHFIQMYPNHAEAYYYRGTVYYEIGHMQNAMEDYNHAIQFNLNYADAYYARGATHSSLGDIQAALKDCHKAVEIYKSQGEIIKLQRVQTFLKSLCES